MQKVWLVMLRECKVTLHSTGFILMSYLLPVVVIVVLVGIRYLQERSGNQTTETSSAPVQLVYQIEGYVDPSHQIHSLPEEIPPGYLVEFENEALAQQALKDGDITAYYVLPPDILDRGEAYYVYPDTRSYLDDGQSWVMAWTIVENLLEGDAELADRVWSPIEEVTATSLSAQAAGGAMLEEDCLRPGTACESNDWARYMPSIIAVLYFFVFLTSSSRLFDSIGAEKENRVIEVLILSISPRQLLAGKLVGLGIAGLLQAVIWSGVVYFAFNLDNSLFNLPENFVFPADIVIGSLIMFLGGYGFYASLMAGAGALVPKMKEAGVANYIVTFPLFIGYAFSVLAPLAKTADSTFLVFLSIFPLTSPLVMIMRLTNSAVPFWQMFLSVGLLYLTAFFTLRAAAAMFHAQNLLSGQPFSLGRYFVALVGNSRRVG